jgi:hypothetical protein
MNRAQQGCLALGALLLFTLSGCDNGTSGYSAVSNDRDASADGSALDGATSSETAGAAQGSNSGTSADSPPEGLASNAAGIGDASSDTAQNGSSAGNGDSTRGGPSTTNPASALDRPSTANSNTPAGATSNTSATPTQREIPRRAPPKRRAGKIELTFDDLKFDIEKDGHYEREMLTDAIESFDQKKIRIRGYMYPTYQETGITQFVLVRDNMECCFGPGAALFDCIVVDMTAGNSADYSTRPIAVEGIFTIQEMRDAAGTVRAVFHLDGTSAE